MKAMILAAGLGTRLRPLTDDLPKPLLPVMNRPQIEFVLELLRAHGVREVIINLHHLGGMIRGALGTSYRGTLSITYSPEAEILGTGGGLKRAEDFFDDEPILLVNADTLMDVDLREAVRVHLEREAAATMVVRDWIPAGEFGRVEMNGEGRISHVLGRGRGERGEPVVFTGVHLLARKALAYIPRDGYAGINRDCYGAMLEAGERVWGFRTSGYWRDIGTLASYLGANMDFVRGDMPAHCRKLCEEGTANSLPPGESEIVQPVFIGRRCRLEEGSRIGPGVVLGDGCTVGRGARLAMVVAFEGSSFAEGEAVRGAIRTGRMSVAVPHERCDT